MHIVKEPHFFYARVFCVMLRELQKVGNRGDDCCKPRCDIDEYDYIKAEENEEVVNDNSNMTTFKVKYTFRSPRLVQVEEEYLIYNALSVLANVGGKFPILGLCL